MFKKPTHISIMGFFFIFCMLHADAENKADLEDWELIWQDEFDDASINRSNWEFDLGTGAPVFEAFGTSSPLFSPEDFPKDNFSVQWDGFLNVNHTGKYTFYIIADDGVRFYLNDNLIIDEWQPQPATEFVADLNLVVNQKYPIRIEYFEEGGGEAMVLGWKSDSFSKSLITSNNLSTDTGEPGLKGTYFPNKSLKLSKSSKSIMRIDKELNWVTSGGWGNNESQYYTDDLNNVRIEDGKLIIEAKKEYFKGSDYTSARIKTKKSWKYGRVEIRAKLPSGRGTWCALWALPTDRTYGPWPHSGEIDILEHVGFNEGEIVGSVHTSANSGDLYDTDQQGTVIIPNVCTEFNNYILEWQDDEIAVSVNNNRFFNYSKQNRSWKKWPFDQRFHLILNIAVGGWWGGAKGIDDNAFPTKMEIDYVRVYTRK